VAYLSVLVNCAASIWPICFSDDTTIDSIRKNAVLLYCYDDSAADDDDFFRYRRML
jgi:hypothetical protein